MYLSPNSRRVAILSKAVLLLLLLLGLGVLCFVHVCGLALLVLSSLAFRLQKKSKLFSLPLLFLTVSVMGLFLVVLWVGLRYVTMTFPVHTHLHFKIHLRSIPRRREILKFHARTQMVRLGVQTAPPPPPENHKPIYLLVYTCTPWKITSVCYHRLANETLI